MKEIVLNCKTSQGVTFKIVIAAHGLERCKLQSYLLPDNIISSLISYAPYLLDEKKPASQIWHVSF